MEKSKVMLLGSQGSLGETIQKELQDTYEIIPFSRRDLDITDFGKVRDTVKENNPAVIINCTAYNAVDLCEQEEEYEKAKMINGYAVENLGKIGEEFKIPIMHFSTDYVFDGTKREGVREDAIPCPISKYGESKALGERLLQKSTDQYYILRVSWLFGPQGSGESTKKSFVEIVQWLAENKEELTLVDDESSSPTYTVDITKQIKYILKNLLPYGIYHVNNSGTASWYEYGKEILQILGIEKRVIPVPSSNFPRPAKRPPFIRLLNTKLPPIRSWQAALEDYL